MAVDEERTQDIMNSVQEDSEYVQNLVNKLVHDCCGTLDEYIQYVKTLLNSEVSNQDLEDIVLTIPSLLYFVGEQQEQLGIRHDMAKSNRNILYNKIFMETAGTVGAKKSVAELQLISEDIVTMVYDRAYGIIKTKVEFATEILQSAKKIISRRMSESDISKSSPNYIRGDRNGVTTNRNS